MDAKIVVTISYNAIGSNGGLGNQMFQYAALRGIAAHLNYDWVIPKQIDYGTSNYGLFECFKMESVLENNFGITNYNSISTGCSEFNNEFFNKCPDNINLHDYFQTEKYFKNVEQIIRKDFLFKEDILESCLEIMDGLLNPIFIHIRRGDYVKIQHAHKLCDIEYYKKALQFFSKDCNVLIFSDDIDWCKEQTLFDDDRFLFSESKIFYNHKTYSAGEMTHWLVPYYDLCLMSLCCGAIIANSSLSWWGAWLQENCGKIIAPKEWFGPNNSHLDTSDLYCDTWEKL